jgi:enoyl-CoA hydratase
MSDPVLLERRGAVALLTLNRPDVLNALDAATLAGVAARCEEIERDADVRALVVTGAGRAFAAGADIAAMRKLGPAEAEAFSRLGHKAMAALEALAVPTIAAVNGFALGGGCELALACDWIYASSKARFGQPEVNLGLLPGFGGTQRLLRLAGRAAALELCLTGRQIDAARALALGIVNQVTSADELTAAVAALADQLAAAAPLALRGILDAVIIGGECGLQQGLDYETQAFAVCASTDDMREGTRAFLERRKPEFSGR